jgi:cellulose synthase/poly-beta-1,6-N-acetylglucosamine synthase-like glycosyltransferase
MIDSLKRLNQLANRHAGGLLLVGLVGVAAYNWRQWQRDKAQLAREEESWPLPPLEAWPELPLVSVLVAAWNEADMIEDHIESFLTLRYPKKELILCAGGDDGTYEIARSHAGNGVVVLEQQSGEGKQAALHRCLAEAGGELVFLTDADCLLNDEAFTRTLAPLVLEGEVVATGGSRPLVGQLAEPFTVYQWCTDTYVAAQYGDYVPGILGRNCAVTRQALEQIDGFKANVRTGTDYHMAKSLLKQGYRIRYVGDSYVESRYPATVSSYWRRQSRWVRNLMIHAPAFGAQDEVAMALRTSLVGLAMLLLPIAALLVGPGVLAAWGVLFFQGFLAKMRYAGFARLLRRAPVTVRQLVWTPAYMLADFVAWGRPLVDIVLDRERW